MRPPRTVTALTAFVLSADPIVTRDDRKHLHTEAREDRAAEYGNRIAVAQVTSTASTSSVIVTGQLEKHVRYLSEGGDWASREAARIVRELPSWRPALFKARSSSHA